MAGSRNRIGIASSAIESGSFADFQVKSQALAPHYDSTGVSAITMAKTLREMIILAQGRKR